MKDRFSLFLSGEDGILITEILPGAADIIALADFGIKNRRFDRRNENVISDFDIIQLIKIFFMAKQYFFFYGPCRSSMRVENIGALVTNDFVCF